MISRVIYNCDNNIRHCFINILSKYYCTKESAFYTSPCMWIVSYRLVKFLKIKWKYPNLLAFSYRKEVPIESSICWMWIPCNFWTYNWAFRLHGGLDSSDLRLQHQPQLWSGNTMMPCFKLLLPCNDKQILPCNDKQSQSKRWEYMVSPLEWS